MPDEGETLSLRRDMEWVGRRPLVPSHPHQQYRQRRLDFGFAKAMASGADLYPDSLRALSTLASARPRSEIWTGSAYPQKV